MTRSFSWICLICNHHWFCVYNKYVKSPLFSIELGGKLEHIGLSYKDIFLSYSNRLGCETSSVPFLTQHSVVDDCNALVHARLCWSNF